MKNISDSRESIAAEINLLRKNPKAFSARANELVCNFKGNLWKIDNTEIVTKEGPKALIEAIAFLKTCPSLEPLLVQEEINQAVDYQLETIISNKDEDDLLYRLNCNCVAFGDLYELISYGNISPFSAILNFIICDGEKNRQSRKILLSTNIKYLGLISSIIPDTQRRCFIFNFVQHFYRFNEKIPGHIYLSYVNEINENVKYIQEKKAQKKLQAAFEEKSLQKTISSASNALNAEDFILSLTRPNSKVYQFLNEKIMTKEKLEEFFSKNIKTCDLEEDKLEELPEGVLKIVVRKISKKNKTMIRKKIYYQDETIDTLFYYE